MLPWVFLIMPLSLNGNEGQINGSTGGLVHNIGVDMLTGCVRYGSVQCNSLVKLLMENLLFGYRIEYITTKTRGIKYWQ